jgi:peptidoglycan/LPS O-acetylase OafA/YrhL
MSSLKNRVRAHDPSRGAAYHPFGTFRLALAGMVLAQHCMLLLTPDERSHWPALVLGPVAVACFFALSGFIVAEAMTRFYQWRPLAFIGNRFLRVVPPYLLVLVLTVGVQSALFAAGRLVPLDGALSGAPWQPRVMLAGALEIVPGLPSRRISGQDFSFIPYAWTLRMEFAFYFAACAACAWRRVWGVSACLALAYGAFARFLLDHGQGTQQVICVPFFAFGLACFFQQRRPCLASRLHLLAVSAFVPLAFSYWRQKGEPMLHYQMICLCLVFVIFYALALVRRVPVWWRRFDKRAGDLSYPLYIGHGVVLVTLLSLAGQRGWHLYGLAIGASVILAAGLHVLAEMPLRGLRDRVRGVPV